MKNAQNSKWPPSSWAELMKANQKYVRNEESNMRAKFRKYRSNSVPTKDFYTLGGAMEPDKNAMSPSDVHMPFYLNKGRHLEGSINTTIAS